nr:MAG TPA: hypothetical protein [Caudoviricetes sp.]
MKPSGYILIIRHLPLFYQTLQVCFRQVLP